jgi:hypothetical protein
MLDMQPRHDSPRLYIEGMVLALALLTVLGPLAAAAQAAGSLYEVAKVSVDTTAEDAVKARALGMAEAGQKALDTLLGRLVPASARTLLPPVDERDVEAMIASYSVRSEQNSTTRYLATFDVRFNEIAVKEYLDRSGVPFSEVRAPQISILPLVLDGESLKSDGAWREAWEGLDLVHSIAPATVLRPRDSLDAETVKKVLAGNARAYEAMQADYGYAPLVLAVGEAGGGKLVTRLAGADSVAAINFGRSDTLEGGDLQAASQHAASIAFGIIENRWKITQAREAPQPVAAAYRAAGPESPRASGVEVPRNVSTMVEFSGLKHWQEIRGRLAHVAGLQALEVNALTERAASISFDFAGPLDKLQAELSQNGFALEDRDGTFVLRSR